MKLQTVFVILLTICFANAQAQTKSNTTSTVSSPPSVSSAKNSTDIPDKWKNESAVVVFQRFNYGYYNQRSGLNTVQETVLKRIKLMDKSAITDFSEFYFYETKADEKQREKDEKKGRENDGKVKIAIVKPSGERITVNISDAVKAESDIPKFYRSYYLGDKTYKKIAIPNLNIGDILEYEMDIDYHTYVNNAELYHAFPAFYNTLATKYPVMKQEFNFMLEQGFYLNLNVYNGAPEFKRLDYGYDMKGKQTDKMRTFQIVDTDRDKLPSETMSLPNTFYPSVKLQVVAQKSDNVATQGNIFTGEMDNGKKTVTSEEVAQRFNKDFRQFSKTSAINFESYAKSVKLYDKSFDEKTKAVYGYVKKILVPRISAMDLYSMKSMAGLSMREIYMQSLYPMKDFVFAVYMSKCLDELDIKHEVIAAMPRNAGKIKDLLLGEEITWVVKAENGAKSAYFYPMNGLNTSEVNRNPYLFGGEGYAFVPTTKRKEIENSTAKKVIVPAPTPSVSSLKTKSVAAFDDQLDKLIVTRESEATGILKDNYLAYTSLGVEFRNEYAKKYDPNYEEPRERKDKKKSKFELYYDEQMKDLVDKQKDLMHGELKSDYDDIVSYDDFELKNAGIMEESPVLSFTEKFKLNNLISKAGRNYTIEIGKMLSKEPKLDDDDLNKPREADIQIHCPKTLIYELELTLPEGYTVEDLKELNTNIENNLMSFKVESELRGDKLWVKTTKQYKEVFAPKTEWQKIIDVFTAAYNFSQKKIVLKKK